MRNLLLFFSIILLCSCTQEKIDNVEIGEIESLKTFGTMGKELTVLKIDEETELINYEGKGCITHMWFGGGFEVVGFTKVRVYVDNEELPSIDMEMYLGHGIGFKDRGAPWGTERMGNIGGHSGIYNTYKIPFQKNIRITAILDEGGKENANFWWIIRGTENLPVVISGVSLPDHTKLKLHKLENYIADPLEEFTLCDVLGSGMLYQVTMEAKGLRNTNHWKDLSYMESCIRAYTNNEKPLFLSSGLEDYFLGTYYFNTGKYTNKLAGLTHFDREKKEFSAYRLHEDDPVFFKDGLRLTNRCGEKIGDKLFHDPPQTRYTVYTWIYEW